MTWADDSHGLQSHLRQGARRQHDLECHLPSERPMIVTVCSFCTEYPLLPLVRLPLCTRCAPNKRQKCRKPVQTTKKFRTRCCRGGILVPNHVSSDGRETIIATQKTRAASLRIALRSSIRTKQDAHNRKKHSDRNTPHHETGNPISDPTQFVFGSVCH